MRACKRINWLSAANSLNIDLTPCLTSKAGTIELGCSDIKDINICKTSCKFSSCGQKNDKEIVLKMLKKLQIYKYTYTERKNLLKPDEIQHRKFDNEENLSCN